MTTNTGIGLALIFAAVLILLASDISYAIQQVKRFQRRRLRSKLSELPVFRWFKRRQRFRADLTEIRDFAINLQLATSLEETLSGALLETAEQFANRGVFGQRLKRQVESKLSISPEEVIRGLAKDFESEELKDLLSRLEMARDGGTSSVEALRVSVEDIEEAIRAKIERDIQRAPVMLTIPMVAGVFFAALVLIIYPLVVRLLTTFTRYP
ncbi:MAG TPA: hypothetical protein EYP09_00975 [Anaerolineae bacterium]|nr:hypothetical protein [Anaerolineae bacterium]